MPLWPDYLQPILAFMEDGGHVLWGIAAVSILLWTLIIERYVYLRLIHPKYLRLLGSEWRGRGDHSSWNAHQIHRAMLAGVRLRLTRSLSLIKALVAVCPLLGLLGTVTGMIHVFDVLSIQGSDNARSMAAGISMATTPTMAGMVVALSGLFFSSRLQHHAEREQRRAAEQLSGLEHAAR
jgi:biopolymer transport protein ExbB